MELHHGERKLDTNKIGEGRTSLVWEFGGTPGTRYLGPWRGGGERKPQDMLTEPGTGWEGLSFFIRI